MYFFFFFSFEVTNVAASVVIYNRSHLFRDHDVPGTKVAASHAATPIFILTLQGSVIAPI